MKKEDKNMDELEKLICERVLMDDKFLGQLNDAVDKVVEDKKYLPIDYDFLEKILAEAHKNPLWKKQPNITKVVQIKKEEMLAVMLDFFKSIDDEFYEKAIKIMLGQYDTIKTRIYNVHQVGDFHELDEDGILKYETEPMVYHHKEKSIVYIPQQNDFSTKESKVLDKDAAVLEDLYSIVHEISHLFDLNMEFSKEQLIEGKDLKRKKSVTRELFCEATTIAFEGLLTNYLLSKKLYSEEAIKDIVNKRTQGTYRSVRTAYQKFILAREKEKSGEITIKYLEEVMKEQNLSVQDIRRAARNVIDTNTSALITNRYAIGGLVAPTIIKVYEDNKEDGAQVLKAYLRAVHDDDFQEVLKVLGISKDEAGISTLIKNMKARDAKINEQRER